MAGRGPLNGKANEHAVFQAKDRPATDAPRAVVCASTRRRPAFDLPGAARTAIEVESVDVERADVRVVRLHGAALAGTLVDLHIAVVPGWVRIRGAHREE